MINNTSPYYQINNTQWQAITDKLIKAHPLKEKEIVEIVTNAWNSIYSSQIGFKPYRIGQDIFPTPQIIAYFLHELIALDLQERYPEIWRKEENSSDKDLVYIPDNKFSIEIKTSSNPKSIFGNRSYAQQTEKSKKSKSGYYLAVNFQKLTKESALPNIFKIRFGWIDHNDWLGQKSQSGQQARLSKDVESFKLKTLYTQDEGLLI